jgi:hypothetical protein
MAYEQRDGQGSLFKNDDKASEKHPDYKGDCTLNGQKYWISAWIKTGKNGKFMSLSLQPKQDSKGRQQGGKQQDDSDSIPF